MVAASSTLIITRTCCTSFDEDPRS